MNNVYPENVLVIHPSKENGTVLTDNEEKGNHQPNETERTR